MEGDEDRPISGPRLSKQPGGAAEAWRAAGKFCNERRIREIAREEAAFAVIAERQRGWRRWFA